ncbi:unnamed protein product [Closterium sp. NIES-53]
MGEHESTTSYCNCVQQILVNLRMAGVDYSQASYITHVVKGLPQQYNLLCRMLKLPQVRKELDEDTLASYIIEEECTLAAEGRKDQLLPQANQVFTKKGKPYFQQTSSPSPPTMAQQQQPKHGGGPGHIAKYCRQRADTEADKCGEDFGSSSAGGKGGDGSKGSGQSSCAMVKPVVEHPPPVMLELEAEEGLHAVVAAVKANPSVVLLDSGCSHHLMGDRSAFVEMSSGGGIKQCKTTVKALCTDRGGEFLGHNFTLFLDEKGIILDVTCPYTPEQNGMAEREMRSIVEAVRTMLLPMGVQHHWWHLALSQAVWVRNRVEHASLTSGVTPYELAFRHKPDQEHGGHPMPYEPLLSLFPGTHEEEVEEEEVVTPPAMPYVPTSLPTPSPPTVYPRVVPPTAPPQSSPPLATPPPPVIPSPLPPSILPAPAPPSSSSSTAPPVGEGGTVVSPSMMIIDGQRLVTEQLQDESSMDGVQQSGGEETGEDGGRVLVSGTITAPPPRRSTRITRGVLSAKYAWAGDKVKEAMDEEMRSLIERRTWELVPRPPRVNVMKNRWILNTKFRLDGIVEREKARLVVKGFTQVAWVDYEETYAPVGSYVTARVLLAIAAALDLDLMQLDMKNAFLHGVLDRDLYMEQLSYYEDGTPRDLCRPSRIDQHWKELDRCLAYLVGSRDVALEFGGGPESLEPVGYANADDAGDKQKWTSNGGYVFVLGGAAVSWASQRIRCATLSSTESEEPTILFVDNSSAISVVGGLGLKGSLKHMECRHMWLQHMVKHRKLQLQYIPTSKQPTDYLTKVLHFPAFSRCFEAVGQVRLSSEGSET